MTNKELVLAIAKKYFAEQDLIIVNPKIVEFCTIDVNSGDVYDMLSLTINTQDVFPLISFREINDYRYVFEHLIKKLEGNEEAKDDENVQIMRTLLLFS
jgi:hypothetical protein